MAKDKYKPVKKAIKKAAKKMKKKEHKRDKIKVKYNKEKDVYYIMVDGKRYILKQKVTPRKLRTRVAKNVLAEHIKNLSKLTPDAMRHSGASLLRHLPEGQMTQKKQTPNQLSPAAPGKSRPGQTSPFDLKNPVLDIPDGQARYQMFAAYNQAELSGNQEKTAAIEEASKAKVAQAAAEEELRKAKAKPAVLQLEAPDRIKQLEAGKTRAPGSFAHRANDASAGTRKQSPYNTAEKTKNPLSIIPEAEVVHIPPKPALDLESGDSVKMYMEFYNNLTEPQKKIIHSEMFGDAGRNRLVSSIKFGFRDWARKFYARSDDGKRFTATTKYFKTATTPAPANASIEVIQGWLDSLQSVYKEYMIVLADLYGKNSNFKESLKTKMDAAQDRDLRDITIAAMGAYAYKNHNRLNIDLSGAGQDGAGLSSTDIMRVMDGSKTFRGIYPVDLIKDIKLLKKEPSSAIINTDVSSGEGKHWVAIYCDPRRRNFEYYDSFGDPPSMEMSADFAGLVKNKFAPSRNGWQMKNNLIREQDNSSDTCGVHAMRFICMREKGIPFKSATPYFRSTEKQAESDIEKIREMPKFEYFHKK
jgi:hypothetical protein